MAWWRSRRWHYDERELMRRSEALFSPKLNLRWKWRGTSFELCRDGKVVWDSSCGAVTWDYPSANCIGRFLNAYMNTPLSQLRRHDVKHVEKSVYSHYETTVENWKVLSRLLLAADRRIGKNHLSVWLFTEPDIRIRNIIGQRV